MDIKIQLLILWAGVAFYAAATGLFIGSITFRRTSLLKLALSVTIVGFVCHSISLLLRWIQVGHGPYLTFYEVTSSDAWVAIMLYLLFQFKFPTMKSLGAVVTPISLLLVGLGVMSSTKVEAIPQTFRTFWLFIHIFFAKLTYGSALIGFGLVVVYLLRSYYPGFGHKFLQHLPPNQHLEDTSYQMFSFSFLVTGVMIAAGSIWANQAWGRYWGWDPVETWSLITWMFMGLYLHLRIIHGWRGIKFAWMGVVVFIVILFALFGVIYLYHSAHSDYLR